tara:strand:- start:2590 stop:3189 length:600 start_codon:yes stop_codon:yes gene_type:complete
MKISIIDYYTGNTESLMNALKLLGYEPHLSNKKDIIKSEIIILPGVGSFGRAMKSLEELDLIKVLKKHVNNGRKLIGICLGMQLLFTRSHEGGLNDGLNLIQGDVKILEKGKDKIPNVGFRNIIWKNDDNFSDFNHKKYYFTHSFVADPVNKSEIIAQFSHNENEYCCGINKNNIFGFQFHPELSSNNGLKLLKKIVES